MQVPGERVRSRVLDVLDGYQSHTSVGQGAQGAVAEKGLVPFECAVRSVADMRLRRFWEISERRPEGAQTTTDRVIGQDTASLPLRVSLVLVWRWSGHTGAARGVVARLA
jgi:hypothetical protein